MNEHFGSYKKPGVSRLIRWIENVSRVHLEKLQEGVVPIPHFVLYGRSNFLPNWNDVSGFNIIENNLKTNSAFLETVLASGNHPTRSIIEPHPALTPRFPLMSPPILRTPRLDALHGSGGSDLGPLERTSSRSLQGATDLLPESPFPLELGRMGESLEPFSPKFGPTTSLLSHQLSSTRPSTPVPTQTPLDDRSHLALPHRRPSLLRTAKVIRLPSSSSLSTVSGSDLDTDPESLPLPSLGADSGLPLKSSPCRHAFVGSYEESLLSGLTNGVGKRSRPLTFMLSLSAMSASQPPRSSPALTVVFPAHVFDLDGSSWTPYIGTVDLETCLGLTPPTPKLHKPPRDMGAGYRLPARGTLQVVIKNAQRSVVKVFLVRFDVSGMPPNSRTILRHKQYFPGTPQRPRALRYALHLPIVCTRKARHYLFGTVRVVFSGLKDSEALDHVTEGPREYTAWVPTPSVPTSGSRLTCARVDEERLFRVSGGALSGDFLRDAQYWPLAQGPGGRESVALESRHLR